MYMKNEYTPKTTVYDIETKPDAEAVKAFTKPFDRTSVKVGNIKDAAKIEAKIEQAEKKHWEDANDKAALDPFTSSICAIVLHHEGEEEAVILEGDEDQILEGFWKEFSRNNTNNWFNYTGSNKRSNFDISHIISRSIRLEVAIAYGAVNHDGFIANCFKNLASVVLAGFDYPSYKSLDFAAQYYGLIGKDVGFATVQSKQELKDEYGIEGKFYWQFLETNTPESLAAARAYLLNDAALTRALCDRIADVVEG